MNWLKEHSEAIATISIILSSLVTCMLWMNGKFNDIDKRFNELEKDMAIVKTVLIMQKIMPAELAVNENGK